MIILITNYTFSKGKMQFLLAWEAFMLSRLWPSFHFCMCVASDKGLSTEGWKTMRRKLIWKLSGLIQVLLRSRCPHEFRTRREILTVWFPTALFHWVLWVSSGRGKRSPLICKADYMIHSKSNPGNLFSLVQFSSTSLPGA